MDMTKMLLRQIEETASSASIAAIKEVEASQSKPKDDWVSAHEKVDPEYARQMLTKLNSLNDKEVDALMNSLLSEEEEQS